MPSAIEQRAREPVASCLIRKLIVPRIYFEAEWPIGSGVLVDVLAIDRDGSGDAHMVLVRERAADALATVPDLLGQPGPFRWIAFVRGTEDEAAKQALVSQDALCAGKTAGRVGVIEVAIMEGGTLGANIRISAERFPGAFYDVSTAFSGSHKADIQFGG
jgi:hypothetical protein